MTALPRQRIIQAAKLSYFGVNLNVIAEMFKVSPSTVCEVWQRSKYWIDIQQQLEASEVKNRINDLRSIYHRKIDNYDQILEKQAESFNAIVNRLNYFILRKISKNDDISAKDAALINNLVRAATMASSRCESLFNSALMVEAIYTHIEKQEEGDVA